MPPALYLVSRPRMGCVHFFFPIPSCLCVIQSVSHAGVEHRHTKTRLTHIQTQAHTHTICLLLHFITLPDFYQQLVSDL